MKIAIQDKLIKKYMDEQGITEFMDCADEAEAVAIAAGHWLAAKKRADVYMSADGFCNTMNFLTSWIMPENIQMNLYVSTGRTETPHKVMTDILPSLLELLDYNPSKLKIEVIHSDAKRLY